MYLDNQLIGRNQKTSFNQYQQFSKINLLYHKTYMNNLKNLI